MYYLHPLLLTAAQCERVLSVYIAVVYLAHMRKSKVGVVTKVRRCQKTFEGYKTFEHTEGSNLRPSPNMYMYYTHLHPSLLATTQGNVEKETKRYTELKLNHRSSHTHTRSFYILRNYECAVVRANQPFESVPHCGL